LEGDRLAGPAEIQVGVIYIPLNEMYFGNVSYAVEVNKAIP
jgi:hypothetical protein